jgi:hypothetical protein
VLTLTPTIYNFSMGIQQEIGFKTILEVSYVGSLARHLGERRNINAVPDGARFDRAIEIRSAHQARRLLARWR